MSETLRPTRDAFAKPADERSIHPAERAATKHSVDEGERGRGVTFRAEPDAEYLEIGSLANPALESIMVRGETPDLDSMVGHEFRGMNIAFWAPYSPILKFIKGFYRAADGRVFGYNEPVVQNGRNAPWIAKPSDDYPKRFGFYLVQHVTPSARDNAYLHGVLLDYSKGGNFVLDPSTRLRDYLVRVNPGSDDLLLGKAYLAFGPARVQSNYFVLQRHKATSFVR